MRDLDGSAIVLVDEAISALPEEVGNSLQVSGLDDMSESARRDLDDVCDIDHLEGGIGPEQILFDCVTSRFSDGRHLILLVCCAALYCQRTEIT